MQKKTKSLLEELQAFGDKKDVNNIVENRASNIIVSAINLIEMFHKQYGPDKAELLERKLLSAIKSKDQSRFSKAVRKKK